MVTPSKRRELAHSAVREKKTPISMSSEIFLLSETCYRYPAKLRDENAIIADELLQLAPEQP